MNAAKGLVQGELIGLWLEVVDADNKSLIGLCGLVVDETKNTLIVEKDRKRKTLLKEQIVFITAYKGQKIKIHGDMLTKRPEDRIKSR